MCTLYACYVLFVNLLAPGTNVKCMQIDETWWGPKTMITEGVAPSALSEPDATSSASRLPSASSGRRAPRAERVVPA